MRFADGARPLSRRRRRGASRRSPRARARWWPPACCWAPLLIGWRPSRNAALAVHSEYLGLGLARQHGSLHPRHRPGVVDPHGRAAQRRDPRALYYPSVFHALAAVFSQLTGAAPTTAYTLSSVAAAVWLFPVSAATLTWQLLRTRTDAMAHRRRRGRRGGAVGVVHRGALRRVRHRLDAQPGGLRHRGPDHGADRRRRCGTATASRWRCWRCSVCSRCTSPAVWSSSCSSSAWWLFDALWHPVRGRSPTS